jgi:hypothetical protein
MSFKYSLLLRRAFFGNRPLRLEPRNSIEQLRFASFDTDTSTQFKLAAAVILLGPTSLQYHRHQRVGLFEGSLGCGVLDKVSSFLHRLIPVGGKVGIGLAPLLNLTSSQPRGVSGKGDGRTNRQLVQENLPSFVCANKVGHGQLISYRVQGKMHVVPNKEFNAWHEQENPI